VTTKGDTHSPFWGLRLSLEPAGHVLVVEDNLAERRPVLERLLGDSQATWASSIEQVRRSLETHGPFDVYCLDYDLGDERGGWWAAGQLIRQHDPRSIAKIVLIHSANTDGRNYSAIFPGAVFIQWDVLATILGVPLVNKALVDSVLAQASPMASEDELREAVERSRCLNRRGSKQ
jgi:CheY-like chemotaxis protein